MFLVANVYIFTQRKSYGYNIISLTRCVVWIVLSSLHVIITLFFKTVSIKCKTHPNEGYYIYSFIYFIFCASLFSLNTADIIRSISQVNDTYENCCVKNIESKQCENVIRGDYNLCRDVNALYKHCNGELLDFGMKTSILLLLYLFMSLFGGLLTYSGNINPKSKESDMKTNLI